MKPVQSVWTISDNQKNLNALPVVMGSTKDALTLGSQIEFIVHLTRGTLVVNKANKLI